MIRVIIVDDHELFRLGLKTVIENNHTDISIVGDVSTGEELFDLLKIVKADLILLDIILPDMKGMDVARKIKHDYPDLKILTISAENRKMTIRSMIDIGIDGFISKRLGGVDVLSEAIRTVASGMEYYGRDISEILSRIYISKKNSMEVDDIFTKQEKRIIELSHEGLTAKQIAKRLNISPRTVDKHKNNIFRNLGINSTVEMIQYAMKKGIIRMDEYGETDELYF